jgi:hypothetical protein
MGFLSLSIRITYYVFYGQEHNRKVSGHLSALALNVLISLQAVALEQCHNFTLSSNMPHYIIRNWYFSFKKIRVNWEIIHGCWQRALNCKMQLFLWFHSLTVMNTRQRVLEQIGSLNNKVAN